MDRADSGVGQQINTSCHGFVTSGPRFCDFISSKQLRIIPFGEGVSSEFYIHRIVWLKMVLLWLHVVHWRYE